MGALNLKEASLWNPNDPITARAIAKKKWQENKKRELATED